MSQIPIAPVKRIMKSGNNHRVSDDAAKYLSAFLEEEGLRIATKAGKLASHAGRKTVKAEDVKLALND